MTRALRPGHRRERLLQTRAGRGSPEFPLLRIVTLARPSYLSGDR